MPLKEEYFVVHTAGHGFQALEKRKPVPLWL